MRIILFLLMLFTFPGEIAGQKFLQIEKYGSLKVRKIPVGGSFYFQLEGEKLWYNSTIKALYVSEGIIQFENFSVPAGDITAIRFKSRKDHWARSIGNKLYLFAGAWTGFSLLGTLVGEPLTMLTAIVPGSAIVLGTLLRWIVRPRVFKIGKKRQLRLLDLSFKLNRPLYAP